MQFPSPRATLCALLATFALSAASLAQAAETPTHSAAPSRPIAGRWIVMFKPGTPDAAALAQQLVGAAGGRTHRSYGHAVSGFSATLPDSAVAAVRNHPNVAWVEQDQTVSIAQLASPENQATWGLDRIDQADLPLDTQYHFTQTGAGVTAFVIDTGLRSDHLEFTGRVLPGYGVVADGNGTNDCNGHGTHVAGTIAGTTWGVAKQASVVPVRVLDCSGSGAWSDVIAGIDWVAGSTARPAVANLSLGGSASSSIDAAVAGAVSKGVTVVVAAGNSGADACAYSPAREPSAITVGATTSTDYRASYSNTGICLDVFAPGHQITSAWYTGTSATNVLSGTSMASPHVAGVAALILQANPTASPAAVASQITSLATPNRVIYPGTGSPNLLVSTLGTYAAAPQPTTQVVATRSLSGYGTRSGGNWRATVTVAVRDVTTGAAIANATVSGSFSPGGSASCVTGSTGSCSVSSGNFKANAVASTSFSVTGIAGTLMAYDPSQNAATQVVIGRP